MGMITSIRAPLPVIDAGLAAPVPRAVPGAIPGGAATVAETALTQAVQQVPTKSAALDPHLLEARMTAETSAAQAAEDARQAYIRASIAAGLSPLPFTGA
ncbi:MAG: hypothetical protein MUE83_02470 [Tabrizicola sp.]|jgi:hypothetical protein|nr:hypothetical protein [Tabrizicola sp.]